MFLYKKLSLDIGAIIYICNTFLAKIQ
jgi:hypothetical protein